MLQRSTVGLKSTANNHVLARTGRIDCRRPCASFPPSSGSTAMSVLCVARWRSARGMIEWICTQELWNPGVAIIFGAAARYRRATVGSSHDDAHPDNSTLHTGAVRSHTGFVESLFFISSRMGHGSSQVFEMLPAFSCILWALSPSIFYHNYSYGRIWTATLRDKLHTPP
jgi:hypothetical protein